MQQRLVGYDAREMWLQPAAAGARDGGWSDQNKRAWLLCPDVDRPLSVDYLVWATLFSPDAGILTSSINGDSVQGLWTDAATMRAMMSRHGLCVRPYWEIAVTVLAEPGTVIGGDPVTSLPLAEIDAFQLIGYDIADSWLLSGLTNCTHHCEPDFPKLQQDYGSVLNAYHLFDDLQVADRFRLLSNRRVPEHAPFHIYGLWRI